MDQEAQTRPAPEPALQAFPDAPRIVIAGQSWPIPPLTPRQNRIIEPRIVPLIAQLFPKMKSMKDALAKLGAEVAPPGEELTVAERVTDEMIAAVANVSLSEEQYDDLVEVVAAALSRAHKEFRRETGDIDAHGRKKWVPDSTALIDLASVTQMELMNSLPTVMKQTGLPMISEKLAKRLGAAGEAPPTGEKDSTSTGTG